MQITTTLTHTFTMTDKSSLHLSNSHPNTPATRSGKKYVHSSVGSAEQRSGFKKTPTVILPGASGSRLPVLVTSTPRAPSSKQTHLSGSSSTVALFGELSAKTLSPETIYRIAELFSQQSLNKVHPYDVILERRLLANPADDLKLSKSLTDTYKGDSKPLEEEVDLGENTVLGTLHWRTKASSGGHLAQHMEGTDRDILCRSFAWAVPLITVWPPPLVAGPEASDNTLWEFQLRNRDLGHNALSALAEQFGKDGYSGAFFAKVSTN